MYARVMNPAGAISELNAPINDLKIETEYVGEQNGRRVWKYRWLKKGEHNGGNQKHGMAW